MVTHCCPTEGKWLVVFKFHSGPNFLLFQTYLSGRWGKQVLLSEMVQLHVKRGDESLFLFNTTVDTPLETLIQQITAIYNGRLKVERLCSGENTLGAATTQTCTSLLLKLNISAGALYFDQFRVSEFPK